MPNGSHPKQAQQPHVTRGYAFSPKFTLRERLRILFGAKVLVGAVFITENAPGKTKLGTRLALTKHDDLAEAAKAFEDCEMKQAAERQQAIALIAAEAAAQAEKGGAN